MRFCEQAAQYNPAVGFTLRFLDEDGMKLGIALTLAFILTTACPAGEPQNIPVAQLGEQFQLIGKLHVPLGKVIEIEGVVVEGPFKGYEGGFSLRVQRIHGRVTQEDI